VVAERRPDKHIHSATTEKKQLFGKYFGGKVKIPNSR
jgi:hypothetical protein